MKNTLINLDCMEWLPDMEEIDTLFADPPDNQGLGYDSYNDKLSTEQYVGKLQEWLACSSPKPRPSGSPTTPAGRLKSVASSAPCKSPTARR